MRGYDLFLLLFAIGAVISMAMPGLMILMMISVIGIPIAILMGLMPAAALVLVLARLVQRQVLDRVVPGRAGIWTGWGSVALVLVGLAALAALDRRDQAVAVAALTAQDINALSLPLPKGVVAIRSTDPATACHDLCRRLLLTGQATVVLLQTPEDPTLPPDPGQEVTAFRLEPRATCPSPALGGRDDYLLDLDRGAAAARNAPSSLTMLLGRITQGTCLIDAPALLGTADVVITRARLSQMVQADSWGLQYGRGLITADLLSVHQREGATFHATYRWTGGRMAVIWPVAIPVPNFGHAFDTGMGLGRNDTAFNTESRFYEAPDWPGFLTQTLGLQLALEDDGIAQTRAAIHAVLDRAGQITDSDQNLIEGYLDGVGTSLILDRSGKDAKNSRAEDRSLYLRLLQDRRVPLNDAVTRALAPPAAFSATELATLAKAAFERLMLTDPAGSDEAEYAGNILAQLPAATLAPYRDTLFQLTEDRQKRWHSWRLLTRLGDFGPEGAARLTFLIGDAQHEDWDQTGDGWQHPYLAGLIGLCEMGNAAAGQRATIDALISTEVLQVSETSYGTLTLNMLISLGYSAEEVTAIAARNPDPIPETRLELEINRAMDSPDCTY